MHYIDDIDISNINFVNPNWKSVKSHRHMPISEIYTFLNSIRLPLIHKSSIDCSGFSVNVYTVTKRFI